MRQRQGKGYLYLESEENALVLFAWAHPEIGPPNSTLLWKFAVLLDLWWTYFEFENGGKVQWSQRSGAALTAHWNNHHFDVDLTALPLSHQKWYNAIANDPDVISLRNLASSSNKFELLRPIVQLHEDQLYGRVSATYYSNPAAQEQWLSQMENLEDYQVLRKAFLAIQNKIKTQGLESPLAARAQREMAKIQEMKLQIAMGSILHMSSLQSGNSCHQSGGTIKTAINDGQTNLENGGGQEMIDMQQEEKNQEQHSSSADEAHIPQISDTEMAEGTAPEAKQSDESAALVLENNEKVSNKVSWSGLMTMGGKAGSERSSRCLDESENHAKSSSGSASLGVKSNEALQTSEHRGSSENRERARENEEVKSDVSTNRPDKENNQACEHGGGVSKRTSKSNENELTVHERCQSRKESNLSGITSGSGRDRHRLPSSATFASSIYVLGKTLNPRGQGGLSIVRGDYPLPTKETTCWEQQEVSQYRGSGSGSSKQGEDLLRHYAAGESTSHRSETEIRDKEKVLKQAKGGGLVSSPTSQRNKKKRPIPSVLDGTQESGERLVRGEELEANMPLKFSNFNQLNNNLSNNSGSSQFVSNTTSHSSSDVNSVPSSQNSVPSYVASSQTRQSHASNLRSNATENATKGPENSTFSSTNSTQSSAGQRQHCLSGSSQKSGPFVNDTRPPFPPSTIFHPENYSQQLSPGNNTIHISAKEGNFHPNQIYISNNSSVFDPSVQSLNFYPHSIFPNTAIPSLPFFFQNYPNSSQQCVQTLHSSVPPNVPSSGEYAKINAKPSKKQRPIQAAAYIPSSIHAHPPNYQSTRRNNDAAYHDKNPPPLNQQRPASPNNSKKQSPNPKPFQSPINSSSNNSQLSDSNHPSSAPPPNDYSNQHIPAPPLFPFFTAWPSPLPYSHDSFLNHSNTGQNSCAPGHFSMSRIVPRINDEEVKRLLNNRQFINIARITGEFFDSLPLDRQRLHLLYCMLQIPSDSEFASFCSMYDRVTRLINS